MKPKKPSSIKWTQTATVINPCHISGIGAFSHFTREAIFESLINSGSFGSRLGRSLLYLDLNQHPTSQFGRTRVIFLCMTSFHQCQMTGGSES